MRLLLLSLASAMTLVWLAPANAAAEPPVRLSIETVQRVHSKLELSVRDKGGGQGVILWCMSPDDPRCMPGSSDSDELSQRTVVQALQLEASAPLFTPPAAQRVPVGFEEQRPSDGVRYRIDRPPRL